jgi:hypothetical protein
MPTTKLSSIVDKISISLDQQSTLAKLLAQEDITVTHGNFRTAWFNPNTRVLGLPVWKNRGKAVYDLLTGHEVGHALYTPANGWHDAVVDFHGAPKAYLNILEDVRIERFIKSRYPGLALQFKRGYEVLYKENFFEIEDLHGDYSSLILIDRINLKSKLDTFIDVEFNAIEKSFFDRAFLTEEFTDVVNLAKEIYAYQKELNAQQPKYVMPSYDDIDYSGENISNDYEKPEVSEDEDANVNENGDQTKNTKSFNKDAKVDSAKDKSSNDDHIEKDTDDSIVDETEAVTDTAFRRHEKDLVEYSTDKLNILSIVPNKKNDVIISYSDYYKQWELEEAFVDVKTIFVNHEDTFKKFKIETEQAAAHMAKEFEMRKAAFQYSRSTIHKTGNINTNKLHMYKYSEDIFLKNTKLANSKNHGMMMFIDFSGSMQHNIGATLRQLLNLTTFCRMINIPFEVYAFTSRILPVKAFYNINEIITSNFNLLNLVSSKMSKKEYNHAFRKLWELSLSYDNTVRIRRNGTYNDLNGTPLNQCIVFAESLIKEYRAKHAIEKMSVIFLSDGDSDSFQVSRESEEHIHPYQPCIIRWNSSVITSDKLHDRKLTSKLLQELRKSTKSNLLGMFIASYRGEAISMICTETSYDNKANYAKQLTDKRVIIEDNVFGYDRFFGLCSKNIDIEDEDFNEVVGDFTNKNQLKSAFSRVNKGKRVNRIMLNAFVESIA